MALHIAGAMRLAAISSLSRPAALFVEQFTQSIQVPSQPTASTLINAKRLGKPSVFDHSIDRALRQTGENGRPWRSYEMRESKNVSLLS